MPAKLDTLAQHLNDSLADCIVARSQALGEMTIEVRAGDYVAVMTTLRDDPRFAFDQIIDLCGVDYSTYARPRASERRFAVVCHLLSIDNNWRLRVRCFAEDDDFPLIPSLTRLWSCADWFEREAFDLFGIVFPGHEDLRRILTDYGFVGHPFRKDFPLSGYVEMRYDPTQRRVVYQPVSIEPREVVPRIVREESYGNPQHG
jgi:NADH-quinone oxidoreductase subunit C